MIYSYTWSTTCPTWESIYEFLDRLLYLFLWEHWSCSIPTSITEITLIKNNRFMSRSIFSIFLSRKLFLQLREKLLSGDFFWKISVWWYMQVDDTEAVNFLVTSQVIPLCLRIMETDSELPKIVCHAIFCICPAMAHHVDPIRSHAFAFWSSHTRMQNCNRLAFVQTSESPWIRSCRFWQILVTAMPIYWLLLPPFIHHKLTERMPIR